MIKVYYNPLKNLRSRHMAILAILEHTSRYDEIERSLALIPILLKQSINELLEWHLIEVRLGALYLTQNGINCVYSLKETYPKSFWEFNSKEKWILGPGNFYFSENLTSISFAGFNPETGNTRSLEEAEKAIKLYNSFLLKTKNLLKNNTIQLKLKKLQEENQPIKDYVLDLLYKCIDHEQLDNLIKKLLSSIEALPNTSKSEIDWRRRSKQYISETYFRWIVNNNKTDYAEAKDIILALWLYSKDGHLKTIALSTPTALSINSEIDIPNNPPRSQPYKLYPQSEKPSSRSASDILKDLLTKLLSKI